MSKKILNFKKTELLSKEELKTIFGGTLKPQCSVYAPVGAHRGTYPWYPCAHDPSKMPSLCPDPNDDFAPPIVC